MRVLLRSTRPGAAIIHYLVHGTPRYANCTFRHEYPWVQNWKGLSSTGTKSIIDRLHKRSALIQSTSARYHALKTLKRDVGICLESALPFPVGVSCAIAARTIAAPCHLRVCRHCGEAKATTCGRPCHKMATINLELCHAVFPKPIGLP
jgi:hypothetical protein